MERPQRLSQFRTGFNAMKVQVEGNIAYVADGSGGMVTINVKNPKFPVEVARFSKIGFVND
ncbi:MAG: hypothetical protein GWN62_35910, partial [Aliifodinibius sp.]|nr:hypothetical protein [Fodinibius sp.]